MSQDISILIKTKIDTSQQQITSLEEQIKSLSSKIKTAISVKLNIDSKDIQLITEKIKEVQEKAQKGNSKAIKVGSFDEANKEMNKMISNFDRIRDHFKTLGDNIKIKQVFSNADESLKKFEVSVDRLNGKIKETSNFKVNINTDKSGKETLEFKNITMASKEATQQIVKDQVKKTEAVKKEIGEVDNLILKYKAAKISAKEFMDAGNKLYDSGKLSGTATADLQERARLIQALKGAEKEYYSSIGQESKNNLSIVNSAYTQQEQALKNIFALSKQKIDAEKNGYVELTTQLKEQIRLEGQKLAIARSDIKSNSLTNSAKEVELLNLKNNLQTEYNNKKSKEADISSQNLSNQQQLLKRTLITMTADIQKFQRQYAGLFDSVKLNQITTDLKNLKISPNLSNDIANLKANFSALQKEAYATSSGLQQANKQVMSLGDALQTAGSKFGIWILMSTLVMGAVHRITESFDYMLEQTKLFTNLQMEMTNQNLKFNEVTQSALDFAKAMGTTSSEVMKAISVFGKFCPL